MNETAISESDVELGLGLIDSLADGIGPRPPASDAEAMAAALIADEFEELGLLPVIEEFSSIRSFGPSYLVVFGLALKAWLVQRRFPAVSAVLGGSAAALGLMESRYLQNPLDLLRTRTSRNVWATIEPAGEAERTICLVSHMDSSRSGLMFHPKVTPHLGNAVAAVSLGVFVQPVVPILRRFASGRAIALISRLLVAMGFGLVLEREIRGDNVPGANDNASGAGACLALASHFSVNRLESTRLVILVTGSEESGVFGIREFLAAHDTEGWDFINFDGVGADAPLRVLSKEGGPLSSLEADPGLMEAAAAVGVDFPELEARPLENGSGLPYDATPVMAKGGRAITIVNQDGPIPNYHWPTDTTMNISSQAFNKAVKFAAKLVRRIDRPSPTR
ncbi:MAG: M28 family metallopeptidase [Solirubrobacterales bacterium]